jgi:hypothetical protein
MIQAIMCRDNTTTPTTTHTMHVKTRPRHHQPMPRHRHAIRGAFAYPCMLLASVQQVARGTAQKRTRPAGAFAFFHTSPSHQRLHRRIETQQLTYKHLPTPLSVFSFKCVHRSCTMETSTPCTHLADKPDQTHCSVCCCRCSHHADGGLFSLDQVQKLSGKVRIHDA